MGDDYYGFCDCQISGAHPYDETHPRLGERKLTKQELQDWSWFLFGGGDKKAPPPAIAAMIREFAEARKRA
jgi:hypothetical protein